MASLTQIATHFRSSTLSDTRATYWNAPNGSILRNIRLKLTTFVRGLELSLWKEGER